MAAYDQNLASYCIGLAIYSYDDLIIRGRPVAVLARRVRQLFHDLALDRFLILRTNADEFEELGSEAFQSGLEKGEFTHFQIFSAPDNDKQAPGVIRAFLGGARSRPAEPNYFFFCVPADYYAADIEANHPRLITVGREAFDFVNGVYGFAHLGFISVDDDREIPSLNPPLAIPPTDFRDLNMPGDLRDEIPYLFWANWISREHADRLGGLDIIQDAFPEIGVDNMNRGALLITSFPTPLWRQDQISEEKLNELAAFLTSRVDDDALQSAENTAGAESPDYGAINANSQAKPDVQSEYIAHALERMAQHVRHFETDYLDKNKAPRNYVWRPYRFCTQDVVLGLTVVRHSVDNNCLEVDVCLVAELPEFEEGSSARVMWSFLLSEAFKCGGTMEIRFGGNMKGLCVPPELTDFADAHGIALGHISEDRITPIEAGRVYLAITQFESGLREQVLKLAGEGRLSIERACYVVHKGLWSQPELTHIVMSTPRADSVLSGETPAEHRLLYRHEIRQARSALLGGILDRKLLKRQRDAGAEVVEREDDVLPLEIAFQADYEAKIYHCSEAIPLPWLVAHNDMSSTVPAASPLIVLIRARELEDLDLAIETDLALAYRIITAPANGQQGANVALLVPRDFEDLRPERRGEISAIAARQNTPILVCPETTASLTAEVARRMTNSRVIRE